MGRRVLRRHIWGYSVCLCPIKRTPVLNELSTEPIVKIEAYYLYRQFIDIIMLIFMTMRLLWLPFNDRSYIIENEVYYGLKQGQIHLHVTPDIENKNVFKRIYLAAYCSNITNTGLSLKHIVHDFPLFFLSLSTSNVRISEGIFCHVDVHIVVAKQLSISL